MQLKEIMTSNVDVVAPTATVVDAAQKMRTIDAGSLPVCDGRRLVGMITDRDITLRATAEARDPRTTLVRDCMSPEVIYCFEDQSETDAERVMSEKQIRRLPVLTREKELEGIVSLGDLATRTGQMEESGRTLRQISEPAHA